MPGEVKAGKAVVEMIVAGRQKIVRDFSALRRHLVSFGKQVLRIGALLGGVAAAGATAFFVAAIKSASDMEETMNKFNVVFGESAEAVKKWSDETASAMQRSKREMADNLATAQSFFKGLGFASDEATDMSKSLTTLAIDFASFNNLEDAEAFERFRQALSGSSEVLAQFGTDVRMASVNAELLNQGIKPTEATEAQKVLARFNLIIRANEDAMGDAARSSGSFANQVKALQATWDNLKVTMGSQLLPVVTGVLTRFNELFVSVTATGEQGVSAADALDKAWRGTLETLDAVADAVLRIYENFLQAQAGILRVAEATDSPLGRALIDQAIPGGLGNARGLMGGKTASDFIVSEAFAEIAGQMAEQIERRAKVTASNRGSDFFQNLIDGLSSDSKTSGEINKLREMKFGKFDKLNEASDKLVVASTALEDVARTIASPSALERSSVSTFSSFRQQKQEEQLRVLERIQRLLERAPIAVGLAR